VTRYSDPGYIVLGAVLERATGQTLDELFRQRIAVPLGLARTGFATPREAFEDAAATETGNEYERELAGAEGAGHRFRETIPRGQVHDGNAHALSGIAGHAGLFGTAGEVAAVGREILTPRILPLDPGSRGRLLRPGGEAGDRTVGFLAAAGAGAARGILPDRAVGHVGFTGTSIWLDPERERVLVLLTNRVHPRVPEADFRWVRRGFHRLAASV
jgi:CubicO group peptidase (beta-lactamase class C family)